MNHQRSKSPDQESEFPVKPRSPREHRRENIPENMTPIPEEQKLNGSDNPSYFQVSLVHPKDRLNNERNDISDPRALNSSRDNPRRIPQENSMDRLPSQGEYKIPDIRDERYRDGRPDNDTRYRDPRGRGHRDDPRLLNSLDPRNYNTRDPETRDRSTSPHDVNVLDVDDPFNRGDNTRRHPSEEKPRSQERDSRDRYDVKESRNHPNIDANERRHHSGRPDPIIRENSRGRDDPRQRNDPRRRDKSRGRDDDRRGRNGPDRRDDPRRREDSRRRDDSRGKDRRRRDKSSGRGDARARDESRGRNDTRRNDDLRNRRGPGHDTPRGRRDPRENEIRENGSQTFPINEDDPRNHRDSRDRNGASKNGREAPGEEKLNAGVNRDYRDPNRNSSQEDGHGDRNRPRDRRYPRDERSDHKNERDPRLHPRDDHHRESRPREMMHDDQVPVQKRPESMERESRADQRLPLADIASSKDAPSDPSEPYANKLEDNDNEAPENQDDPIYTQVKVN